MRKTFDVAVIGNVGIDTNVYLYGDEIDFTVEANFTQNIDYLGQAGGYASRGYRRQGRRTAFIGHVGDDYQGRFIREVFARDGIDTTALFSDPTGTARSVNIMYPDGRRKNFYDGKSHMTLTPNLPACRDVLSRARLAHFNIPNWARTLLPIARESGTVIACDLQDVVRVDDPYRQEFVEAADFLFFSAANHPDPTPLFHEYWKRNPGCVLVSGMGERGCALGVAGRVEFFAPVPMPETVMDTNGAGDGLAVGFLTSHVLEGRNLRESILRGQITARYTCAQKASTDNLITAAQVDAFYKEMAEK
ncbi:MAG: carbohydrate kinase family protein [Anaerolineales bacterium]